MMYAAIFTDGNDCSWSFDHVLGIFTTRSKADEICLRFSEANISRTWNNLGNYEVKEFEPDVPWATIEEFL